MVNQNLGITAKVEPEVDKSSQSRMMRDLEKDIEELEELTFESDGIKSKATPGGGSGGGMGAGMAGGAMARGGGGGLLKGAAGGAGMMAGAAVMGTVALGGVLAEKMYTAMSEASGRLSAVNSILGKTMDLLWKPFGDALGNHLIPFAVEALDMAENFNDIYQSDGLGVAIKSLAGDVESKLGLDDPSIEIPSPEDVFGFMEDFTWGDYVEMMEWGQWLNPLAWSSYVYDLGWRTYVNSLTWGNFMNTLRWVDFVHPMEWSTFIDYLDDWGPHIGTLAWDRYVGNLRWSDFVPSPSGSVLVDMLFGHINIDEGDLVKAVTSSVGGMGSVGGGIDVRGYDVGGNARSRSRDPRSTAPTSSPSSTRSRERAAAEEPTEVNVNNTLEVDGHRLAKAVRKKNSNYFTRI